VYGVLLGAPSATRHAVPQRIGSSAPRLPPSSAIGWRGFALRLTKVEWNYQLEATAAATAAESCAEQDVHSAARHEDTSKVDFISEVTRIGPLSFNEGPFIT